MSMFNIGLSGLSTTQKALEVTSNNIANSNTAGYKTAGTEFSAVYNGGQRGGVAVAATAENFEKSGSLVTTGQGLDLAITGKGFFIISDNGRSAYTQAGQFKLDNERNLVTNNGNHLQGFGLDDQGNIITGVLTNLKVEAGNIPAKATGTINFSLNLNSGSAAIQMPNDGTQPATAVFSPRDGTQYNYSQSTEFFDSLGNSHTLTQYFNHIGQNEWAATYFVDGKPLSAQDLGGLATSSVVTDLADPASQTGENLTAGVVTLRFTTDGQLSPFNPSAATDQDDNLTDPLNLREVKFSYLPEGATPMSVKVDLVKTTQFGSSFGIYENTADGYTSGEFNGVAVDEGGRIYATFSNGATKLQGQLALANFANPQGLESANNTTWYASAESGAALIGVPAEGSFGTILAGAYTGSNVDISKQLVDLMSFQQSYQANAKTISTADEMMQILFNAV